MIVYAYSDVKCLPLIVKGESRGVLLLLLLLKKIGNARPGEGD